MCQEIRRVNFSNSGCVEVAFNALGVKDIDLPEFIQNEEKSHLTKIFGNYLGQKGFIFNGGDLHFNQLGEVSGDEVEYFLQNNKTFTLIDNHDIKGRFSGVLLSEEPNNEQEIGHVQSILPRQDLPRDVRRKLKKDKEWLVIDTRHHKGFRLPTSEQLANEINEKIRNNIDVFGIPLYRIKK